MPFTIRNIAAGARSVRSGRRRWTVCCTSATGGTGARIPSGGGSSPADDFRRDSDLFVEGLRHPEAQHRMEAAMNGGFQTPEAELDLAGMLAGLGE